MTLLALLSETKADPDLWGHVLGGRDIIRTGLSFVDPYSFTADQTWVNHQWLAEVVWYGAWRIAGQQGLIVLKLALLLGVAMLVHAALATAAMPVLISDLLMAVWALGVVAMSKTVRPQLCSLLLFALLLRVLGGVSPRRILVVVTVMMALWANVHGGWIVGILVLAISTLHALVVPGARRAALLLAVVAMAATLLTPYGLHLWRFMVETIPGVHSDIAEWQPIFAEQGARFAIWALTCGVAFISLRGSGGGRSFPLLLLGILGVASFRVARLAGFFATATIMVGGPGFGAVMARRPSRAIAQRSWIIEGGIVGLAIAVSLVSGFLFVRNLTCIRMAREWGPDVAAARFIRANDLHGRLLTWFDWGEYVMWHFGPRLLVSMDGRRETVYSSATLEAHRALYLARPGYRDYLARLVPDYAWLPKTVPLSGRLGALGWKQIYETESSAVWSRADPGPFRVPAISELPGCFPGNPD